jgi:hypothetical protein
MGIDFATIAISNEELIPEQLLWRGVLVNAIEDTLITQSDRKSSIIKLEAHDWIINSGEDFQKVCYWSGFTPEHINEKYIQAIKRGDITFNFKQVAWGKYYLQYKLYKKCQEYESKKYHRKRLESLRKVVIEATTAVFTSILISTAY